MNRYRDDEAQPWRHDADRTFYKDLTDPQTGEKAELTARPANLVPWCGQCDPMGAEHWSSRWIYDAVTGKASKCPRCHPYAGPTGPLVKLHKKRPDVDRRLTQDQVNRKMGEVRSQIHKRKRDAEDGGATSEPDAGV